MVSMSKLCWPSPKKSRRKAAEKPLSVVRPFGHRAMVRLRIQRHRNFKRVTRSATMCRAGTGPMSSRKVVVSDPMDSMDPKTSNTLGKIFTGFPMAGLCKISKTVGLPGFFVFPVYAQTSRSQYSNGPPGISTGPAVPPSHGLRMVKTGLLKFPLWMVTICKHM